MDAKCSIPLRPRLFKPSTCTETLPRKCQGCSFEASSNLLHLRHAVLSAKQCKGFHCEHCYEFYPSERGLQKHVKNQHPLLGRSIVFACPHCDHQLSQKANIEAHIVAKHLTAAEKAIQWYQCNQCRFQTAGKASLKNHVARKHSTLSLSCELCDYTTKSERALVKHSRRRHKSNPNEKYKAETGGFKCLECDFTSKFMCLIREHICAKHLTEEEKVQQWHKCPSCNFRCSKQYGMKAHIFRKHVDKTSLEWLKCDYCKYKSKVKDNLASHIALRHNDKKLEETNVKVNCTICKKMIQRCYLKTHVEKMHENKFKELQCGFCEKVFKWRTSFKRHIQKEHAGSEDKQ